MNADTKPINLSLSTPEQVIKLEDEKSGLQGVIVVHSTALGPAAGGCRFWRYPSLACAQNDALRLAAGMSYKNALADLPLGGGKAVIKVPAHDFSRNELFKAFGRAVDSLAGEYVTAEDVGTTVEDMACASKATRHVAGLANVPGRPGGDPSPHTARGVFEAMKVAIEYRLGRPLSGSRVAVQGLGNVGFRLCEMLHEAGAELVISETRSDVATVAVDRFGADIAEGLAIYDAQVDVFAPCALGGALDPETAQRLRAKVVCGGANNQLAMPEVGQILSDRDILYAPDYLVNAGGIINVAGEYLGWSCDEVADRVSAIAPRLQALLELAERERITTDRAADEMAEETIKGAGRRVRAA